MGTNFTLVFFKLYEYIIQKIIPLENSDLLIFSKKHLISQVCLATGHFMLYKLEVFSGPNSFNLSRLEMVCFIVWSTLYRKSSLTNQNSLFFNSLSNVASEQVLTVRNTINGITRAERTPNDVLTNKCWLAVNIHL